MPKPANPIPPGFHSLTAHLSVNGAAAYSDFLKRAFSAVEVSRSPGPGGKLMHVEVRIGDSVLNGHVRDPFGFLWSIATRKEELTPEEMHERQAKAFAAGHP